MKLFRITMLFAVLALSACTVEKIAEGTETSEQELTIVACIEGGDVATRTYRDDSDGSVWWVPGDAISLFYGQGTNGGSKFTSTATDTVKITNFTGSVIPDGAESAPEETYYWGLYPYSETASCDGSSVTMTLPPVQTATAGSFATGLFPSLGRSKGLQMGFYNICSGLKFTVTKAGVKKVTLKSRNGELIAGMADVSFDDDGHPVAEIVYGQDEVSLEAPAGKSFEVGRPYFLVFFPTTFTGGFTVTLETLSETGVYEKTREITAKRSVFGSIPDIDAGVTYTPRSGNIPIGNASFKTYLVQRFDTDRDGEISFAEAGKITAINCALMGITSAQGIEYMPNLNSLDFTGWGSGNNTLLNLDVSNNPALTFLDCSRNRLTSLDVSNNPALTTLHCGFNQLTNLDVSNNPALTELWCHNNLLTDLDVSNNPALSSLSFYRNQLTGIDVSNNPALTALSCTSNKLTNLDVSKNPALSGLECYSNLLTSLDVSNNPSLSHFKCAPMNDSEGNNLFATLYVSKGQSIPNITSGRSEDYIPAETRIVVIGVPEPVDLGLSVKWASFNVGATTPEEYGDYFAWGETEPETDYSWSSYKWCNGDYNKLTKYCPDDQAYYWDGTGTPDDKTALEINDDAAYTNLGREWRMPTDAEWTELRENCNWTWTSRNGVNGFLITATNGNSIFLPAAGCQDGSASGETEASGIYWSSSLYTDNPLSAWAVEFGSGAVNGSQVRRCLGISVRPVSRRIQPESIVLNRSSLLLYPGMSEQLTATISPANAADKMVSWTSDNTSAVTIDGNGIVYAVAIGSATITATTHDGNLTATCTVTVRQPVTGAVDLGLSVKWASFNVGATAPEEYGDYFAWGETESKTDYSWSSYKWCNGDYNKLTKYCLGDQSYYWNGERTPDGKTVLDPEDDPAITNWGGTWRTPTDAEWTELRHKCTWTWTSRNGVNGFLITATNGNSIFLPAAGYRDGSALKYTGAGGLYWSSSLHPNDSSQAWGITLDSYYVSRVRNDRRFGVSVRPVECKALNY